MKSSLSVGLFLSVGKIFVLKVKISLYRKAKTEMPKAKDLKAKEREELLSALQARFEKNMNRH
jgi:hypothetical protein